MVAPKAETIFTMGRERRPVGILLSCPDCSGPFKMPLRCEVATDYPIGKCPDLVGNAGPLGFILRCDSCGFRVELHGDRLPTVAMLKADEQCNPELGTHSTPHKGCILR